MSRALITEGYLTDIANAIRAKNGSSDTYTPSQMAGAIDSIPNYPEPTGSMAIRQNGAVNVKDYATANVSVPNSYTVGDEGKVVQNGTLIGQSDKNINANGRYNTTANKEVVVSVPNSYTLGDEGKVVQGGALVGQSGRNINVNGRYNTTTNNEVVVNVAEGGSARVIPKNISANGNYDASSDHVDGYSSVNVNVPNTYGVGDEGKVVDGGELVAQTPTTKNANGTYDTTTNNQVVVDVPNTYTQADEGKVVDDGELVEQTSTTKNANGTYDTTTNNQVVVDVPNTYTQADEGKVVDNGALVSQTSRSVTANGTYTTTTNNEVVVNVQPNLQSKTVTENGTVTADSGYDGLSQVDVNVQGGVAPLHILASNIRASNQSLSAGISPSWKKFLLMAINSDASNVTLNPDVDIESSPVTAETTEYHEYSSSGDNRRNYSINVYDISENAGDGLYAGFTTIPAHMSWLYAYVSADFEISKVMTSAEAATSGSNSEDGCVLYGTINDNSGGTLTAADYTAGTTITTDNPGSGYKSSFIIWLTKAIGDVTVEPLSVTQNGTYTAPTGKAYSPVTVNVSGGGGSEPQLPSSYQEVEYLATGGNAYITPSIVLNPGTLIKAKATRNSANAQTLIGNRTDATARWDVGYENGAWYATNSCFLIVSNVAGDPTAELLVGLANTVSTGFRYGAYLYSTKYNFDGNLYKLKIYAPTELTNPGAHTLQALFYPCRRKADDVLGFYDAINDVFYPNDGNGTFTPGPDVN